MPFDGIFAGKITEELQQAVLCHIDKIYQPSYDELVFLLRKKDFSARLLLCARSGATRVQFTEIKRENPATAPLFCMLARKYFSGAKLLNIEQMGRDRLLRFSFETTDEMGDRVYPQIVCELMGASTNIILLHQDGTIIDALHRTDPAKALRLIQPGARYELPAPQEKSDPVLTEAAILAEQTLQKGEMPLSRALLETLDGFSPLICRELCYRAFGEDPLTTDVDTEALCDILKKWQDEQQHATPTLLWRDGKSPSDYTYLPIMQYGEAVTCESVDGFSRLLDRFYAERDLAERIRRTAAGMTSALTTAEARIRRRQAARREDLIRCEKMDVYRIYGELLKANLYAIAPGSRSATVQNYYDESGAMITIPLDEKLSPANNAAKYFKDYKKSRTAQGTLENLIAEDAEELRYIETVLDSIARCKSTADLLEIGEELQDSGYLLRSKKNPRKTQKASELRIYTTPSGLKLAVGKNNRQNDELTLRTAHKNDWWFHVKNGPGCHAVLLAEGKEVPEEDLLMAAQTAAYFSKAQESAQVPVDYTRIRHVKKPNGAKPGMVIYTDQKTLFVTPRKPEEEV